MKPAQWIIVALAICLAITGYQQAGAGETLYNGIVLPDQWPPQREGYPDQQPPPPYLESPPDPIIIDTGRQLFVDDFLIESTDMTRAFHRPVYHPANPVIKPDRDHEMEGIGPFAAPFSGGVWVDPIDGRFRMFYKGGYIRHLCLATSDDGIVWSKDDLGVVPGTNMVINNGAPESNTVWLDLFAQNPEERYKYFIFSGPGWRMNYRRSPDGIHWSDYQWPQGSAVCGDRTTVFYNPFRGKWVFSIRAGGSATGRARLYWEADDLNDPASAQWPATGQNQALATPWTRSELGLDYARLEISSMPELYNLDCVAYESLMLGMFSILRGDFTQPADRRPTEPGRPKCNEIHVGFSRDGFHWTRPDGEAFLGISDNRGDWNWGNVQSVSNGGLVVGDHIYFYVSGRAGDPEGGRETEWIHDANASTGLAVLRRDGFASMNADGRERTLTTRNIRFKGAHLFLNIDAPEGELRVEILDSEGRVIAPFTWANSNPVSVNSTIQRMTWNGADDLSALAGRDLKFRFHLTGGSLYAFWVSPDISGASHGFVMGGGPGFTGPSDTVGIGSYIDGGRPWARAGDDMQVRLENGEGRRAVTLDGSKSAAREGGRIMDWTWLMVGRPIATGAMPQVELPVGRHVITLAVADENGEEGFDSVTVTVLPESDPVPPREGLVMWLKADGIEGVEDGAGISEWPDAAGNNMGASQGDAARRPVWVRNAVGGRPAVRFGDGRFLDMAYCRGPLYTYAHSTVFAVLNSEQGGTVVSHAHTMLSLSRDRDGGGRLFYSSAFPASDGRTLWTQIGSSMRDDMLGRPVVCSMARSGDGEGETALYINGRRDDDGSAFPYHNTNADRGAIGSARLEQNLWTGDIAEIIVYGRALPEAERRAVEEYLMDKYDIQAD